MADGHGTTKCGGSAVNVQIRLLPRAEDPHTGIGKKKPKDVWNCLTNTLNIATFSGKETYDELKAIFSHFLEDMTHLAEHGLFWTNEDGTKCRIPLRFWGGGDLSFWSKCMGMGGDFASNACNLPQCFADKADLCECEIGCKGRDHDSQAHLAHQPNQFAPENQQFPFTCPGKGCGKTFESQADCDADLAPKDKNVYRTKHFGVNWGQPPLLPIMFDRIIPCTLHCLLTCTKRLWRSLICERVISDKQVWFISV